MYIYLVVVLLLTSPAINHLIRQNQHYYAKLISLQNLQIKNLQMKMAVRLEHQITESCSLVMHQANTIHYTAKKKTAMLQKNNGQE